MSIEIEYYIICNFIDDEFDAYVSFDGLCETVFRSKDWRQSRTYTSIEQAQDDIAYYGAIGACDDNPSVFTKFDMRVIAVLVEIKLP